MTGDNMVIYRCTECGKMAFTLGYIHGHAEKHNGIGPFNIIPHPFKTANPNALDEFVEELHVTVDEVRERA